MSHASHAQARRCLGWIVGYDGCRSEPSPPGPTTLRQVSVSSERVAKPPSGDDAHCVRRHFTAAPGTASGAAPRRVRSPRAHESLQPPCGYFGRAHKCVRLGTAVWRAFGEGRTGWVVARPTSQVSGRPLSSKRPAPALLPRFPCLQGGRRVATSTTALPSVAMFGRLNTIRSPAA